MGGDKQIDPFDQGLRASMDARPENENPYDEGSAAYLEWKEGWTDGEESWSQICKEEIAAGRPRPEA